MTAQDDITKFCIGIRSLKLAEVRAPQEECREGIVDRRVRSRRSAVRDVLGRNEAGNSALKNGLQCASDIAGRVFVGVKLPEFRKRKRCQRNEARHCRCENIGVCDPEPDRSFAFVRRFRVRMHLVEVLSHRHPYPRRYSDAVKRRDLLSRPDQTLRLEWYPCVALQCGKVVISLWRAQKYRSGTRMLSPGKIGTFSPSVLIETSPFASARRT